MPYELIITEKPNAAKKIAEALAHGKPIKKGEKGVAYYEITHGNKDIVVSCAVGHLYGLQQNQEKYGKKWVLPVFDVEWVPTSEMSKNSEFSKKYLSQIKKLAKDAESFTVATDFDVEGEVIGLNIVRFACKKKDANRMKFSTLTKDDLIESYGNKAKHLEWGQAEAGETRHILDWYYGINTSRALTSAIKKAGMFKLMSTGRVQGPALKLIVDKEREIKVFKSEPYWQIELLGEVNKGKVDAWHKQDKFWDKKEADKVMKNVKGAKEALVDNVEKKQFNQVPPIPFDLTSLQIEAHRTLGISPKNTLEIAQDLYTSGYISYPRTSSQQLSEKIGFKKILSQLNKQTEYKKETDFLLEKKELKPNNGKKTDPAHPAIYPTGIKPNLRDTMAKNLYDLIVRRFLATFGDDAVRETAKIEIDCNKEMFVARGTVTIVPGWHKLYGRFAKFKDEELPKVVKGDKVKVEKIVMHDKETQPPSRYTDASIIKELEKRNLGTKATRAAIIDTLFQRGYIDGKQITATELGIRTLETLEKHCPTIIDEELTKHFEDEMEEIREGKRKQQEVLEESKEVIKKIIEQFKKDEKEIGEELKSANIETRDEMSLVGNCMNCKDGQLHIRKGKFGSFVACNKYPDCKTTFSLPSNAFVKPAKKICETCKYPEVLVIKRRKKPQIVCINKECKSKHVDEESWKEAKEIREGIVEKECPECKEGNLVLRSSMYGKFLGCSRFPKCKYTEKIGDGPLKEDFKNK